MFTQLIDPLNNLTLTCLVALIPVVFLLPLAGGSRSRRIFPEEGSGGGKIRRLGAHSERRGERQR